MFLVKFQDPTTKRIWYKIHTTNKHQEKWKDRELAIDCDEVTDDDLCRMLTEKMSIYCHNCGGKIEMSMVEYWRKYKW